MYFFFYLFLSFFKFFQIFSWILNNFCIIDIFVKISTDISNISAKSKYQYICVYWYFKPWMCMHTSYGALEWLLSFDGWCVLPFFMATSCSNPFAWLFYLIMRDSSPMENVWVIHSVPTWRSLLLQFGDLFPIPTP